MTSKLQSRFVEQACRRPLFLVGAAIISLARHLQNGDVQDRVAQFAPNIGVLIGEAIEVTSHYTATLLNDRIIAARAFSEIANSSNGTAARETNGIIADDKVPGGPTSNTPFGIRPPSF